MRRAWPRLSRQRRAHGLLFVGVELYDFAVPWDPDFSRMWDALGFAAKATFTRPWEYAFAWPLAVAFAVAADVCRDLRNGRGLFAALIVAAVSTVAFAYVFSLSRAPDFGWHLHTAMPRLLWTPALPLVLEVGKLPRLDAR